MVQRILNKTTQSVGAAALILGAASFISRVLGVVRNRIFAHEFGASELLDIYYASFKIPDTIYNIIIVGALSAGFIPVFMKVFVKNKEKAWRLTNTLISLFAVILLIFALLLYLAMPSITPYIVPGFDQAALEETIRLSRIMLISPIILGISGIISGVLQSVRAFLIYSLTPIFYNLGIIFGAVVLSKTYGIIGLAYGVIIGTLLHLVIQLPVLFSLGFKIKPNWDIKSKNVREIGRLMIPRTLAMATHQINLLVTTIIASTLAAGSITIFTFANDLQYFPVGIIGLSFALAAFPAMSEAVANDKVWLLKKNLIKTVRLVLVSIIPITVLFMLLRVQITRIILGTGQFDWSDTILTGHALAFFSFSLFAQCIIPTLNRAFYALHNTRTPLVIAFTSSLINIIAALVLKDDFGVVGLAMAFSIGILVQLGMLWISLRRDIGSLKEYKLIPLFYKLSAAALVMTIVVQFTKNILGTSIYIDMTRFWGVATQAGVASIFGIICFFLVAKVLSVQEVGLFVRYIEKRFF